MTRLTGDWIGQPGTRAVMALLTGAGHRALFVGGCVRNALLDAPVNDIDIATDARPEVVSALAEGAGLRVIPTGIAHGTVTVVADGVAHEVTTFRRDVSTDGRRATVSFTDDVAEDALRRDFTMNALYAEADGTIVDPLGGIGDLTARRVRFIEDPAARIKEDYLRILRFFRFHAWYGDPGQGLDAEGLAACAALSGGIETLSRERIGAELLKLLAAPDPGPAMASFEISGGLMRALPGADTRFLAPFVAEEARLGRAPDPLCRLAVIGGEAPAEALRLSRAQARMLEVLRAGAGAATGAGELGYREGVENAERILLLRSVSAGAQVTQPDLDAARHGAVQVFPVEASDLMPGLTGPALGDALKAREARWIRSGFALTRDELL